MPGVEGGALLRVPGGAVLLVELWHVRDGRVELTTEGGREGGRLSLCGPSRHPATLRPYPRPSAALRVSLCQSA